MTTEIHGKLHHMTPGWVADAAIFHIRLRVERSTTCLLTEAPLAQRLLDSVQFYERQARWYPHLFLLMPDHLHALLEFDLRANAMARVIGEWKGYHARQNGVRWQENFFDHRIRNRAEFDEKASYIRMNPVRKGLCQAAEAWTWLLDRTTAGAE